MHREYEVRISEFEHARNDAMDKYFEARPQLERTRDRECVFEAGYRMAWEFLMPKIEHNAAHEPTADNKRGDTKDERRN